MSLGNSQLKQLSTNLVASEFREETASFASATLKFIKGRLLCLFRRIRGWFIEFAVLNTHTCQGEKTGLLGRSGQVSKRQMC